MNNNQYLFTRKIIFNYVCTTLDGNYISGINGNYVIWQIDNIRKEEDKMYLDIVYFTSRSPKIERLEGYQLNDREVKRLQKIEDEDTKSVKRKEEADIKIHNKIINRSENIIDRGLKSSLKQYYKELQKELNLETMSREELLGYISSDDFLQFQEWGRKNSEYVKFIYMRNYYEEFVYRDFIDITFFEVIQMLRASNIIRYGSYAKVSNGRRNGGYPFFAEWSPYIERAYVGDPFTTGIIVEKDDNRTVVDKEWIPEKRITVHEGLDNETYITPGHYEETVSTVRDRRKEGVSYGQLLDAQEYCLSRQIGPEWIKTKKLILK